MDTVINRHFSMAKWADGDVTVMIVRFVHKGDKIIKQSPLFVTNPTLSSVKRIDYILNRYKGGGVWVNTDAERTMLTQTWDNVYMIDGQAIDRYEGVNAYVQIISALAKVEAERLERNGRTD